jgi:hypothetical protein
MILVKFMLNVIHTILDSDDNNTDIGDRIKSVIQ